MLARRGNISSADRTATFAGRFHDEVRARRGVSFTSVRPRWKPTMADASIPVGRDDGGLPVTAPHEGAQQAGRPSEAAGVRFELGEEIARGGMGAIYRAVD